MVKGKALGPPATRALCASPDVLVGLSGWTGSGRLRSLSTLMPHGPPSFWRLPFASVAKGGVWHLGARSMFVS